MSTLFETFYDSFGHELYIGSPVFFRYTGHILFGTLVKFSRNKSGEVKYNIIPSVKYKENGIKLRRNYNISEKNVFLAIIKKK